MLRKKIFSPTLPKAVQPTARKNIFRIMVDMGTRSSRVFLYKFGSVVDSDSLNPDTDPGFDDQNVRKKLQFTYP